MIEWSIDAFRACESVHSIVVAAPPGYVHDLARHPDLAIVSGGATRTQSVVNALEAVGTALVAIHDAARPLLTPDLVEELVARLDADPAAAGVIAATPVTDTIKQAAHRPPSEGTRPPSPNDGKKKGGFVVQATLDRSLLWAAQTPQVFRADALREALAVEATGRDAATDEAFVVEAAGGTVLIHQASPQNLKVTTPLDLEVSELLLAKRYRDAVSAE